MKLCVFGPKNSPEAELIRKTAEEMGVDCKRMMLSDIYFETTDTVFKAEHRKLDLLDYDAFVFRPLGKDLWKGLVIAEYLQNQGKVVLDKCLTQDRWSNEVIPLKLHQNNLPFFSHVTAKGIKTTRDILMDLDHPIVIKMDFDGQKSQVVFSDDWTDSYDMIRTTKAKSVTLRKTPDVNYFYQVYVVGEKVIGALKKTCLDGEFKLNYSETLKSEVFEPNEEMIKLAQDTCRALNLDIASVDFIEDEGKLYILDVDRAPRFSKVQRTNNILVSNEIIELAKSKINN